MRACLSAWLLLLLAAGTAQADVPYDARALADEGRTDEAAQRLDAWVRSAPEPSESALVAAEAAEMIGDADLLERLQGWLEGHPKTKVPGYEALALATIWLARAEGQLAAQKGGAGTAFLFADAEAKAKACLTGGTGPEALALLARARYAQGDAAGALAVLVAHPEVAVDPAPSVWEGRLLYEQALASGLDAEGRPTATGSALLKRAMEALARALDHPGRSPRFREARFAAITLAYAHHRLGDVEAATRAYSSAHEAHSEGTAALRGLASLLAHDPEAYRAALRKLIRPRPADRRAVEALVDAHLAAREFDAALEEAERRTRAVPTAADAQLTKGRVLLAADRLAEAETAYRRAHELAPTARDGIAGLEAVAARWMATDVERGIVRYEAICRLLPDDAFVRNNLGFLLREAVTPFTTREPNEIQRLTPDAPERARTWLARSVAAYAEAVALLPEARDKALDEAQAWNAAGIVNDYALMLHYFVDVQDLPRAEALYWRALRLTQFGFKDTYAPNLQRLYGTLLPDREWAWYQAARRARDAILVETGAIDPDTGAPALAPDTAKREAASRDVEALRTRLVGALKDDAESDGVPFPPAGPEAGDGGSAR